MVFGIKSREEKRQAIAAAAQEKRRELEKALLEDDVEGAKKLNFGRQGREDYYKACVKAVEHGAPHILEYLLAPSGFDFAPNGDGDRKCARALFEKADESPERSALWAVLYTRNQTTRCGQLSVGDTIMRDISIDQIHSILENNLSYFETCINKVGLYSTEKLKFILTFTPHPLSVEAQSTFNNALIKVAALGDVEKGELLLAREADANYAAARALLRAGEGNHLAMVNALLPHINLSGYGDDIAAQLEQKGTAGSVVSAIRTATRTTAQEQAIAQSIEPEGFTRLNSHTLEEVQKLSSGSTLTTLFNFQTRQQKDVVTNEAGISTSVTVTPFATLDKDVITALEEKLADLGKPAPLPASPRIVINRKPS